MQQVLKDPQEKTIDDITYRVGYLTPRQVLRYSRAILKMVLPSLGAMADGLTEGESIQELLGDSGKLHLSFAEAAERLVTRMDDKLLDELIVDLSKVTEFSGDGEAWPRLDKQFDIHFTARPRSMLAWLAFALEVQFADFFDGWRERATGWLADLMSKAKAAPSQSPSTLLHSGLSGASS